MVNYGYSALSPRMEMGVSAVVVDYALWNFRYWLPRRAGFARYGHAGDELDAEYSETITVQALHDWDFEVEEVSTRDGTAAGPEPTAEEVVRAWREEGDTVEVGDASEPDSGTVVTWSFDPPFLAPGLLRYNPVEGLSAGTRLLRRFPWGWGALTVRTATRRAEPNIDFSLEHVGSGPRVRLSVYHTLRETGGRVAGQRPERLEPGADSSWYYVARGAALQLLPARDQRFWTSLRLFSETTTTLDGDARRRTGADVYWRPWWGGLTGRRVNGGADVSLRGLFGDFPTVRLSVMGGLVVPLPAGLSVALEAGGANIWGDPAPEEAWRLGGSGDWLRGYPRVVLRGSEVWRSRAELQRRISLLTASVFHDWAPVDGGGLQSAGVGISIFNGFVRADLGRPLSPWYDTGGAGPHSPGWKGHLRAFAPF